MLPAVVRYMAQELMSGNYRHISTSGSEKKLFNSIRVPMKSWKPMNIIVSEEQPKTIIILWNEFVIFLYTYTLLSRMPVIYYHEHPIVDVQIKNNMMFVLGNDKILNYALLRTEDKALKPIVELRKVFSDVHKIYIDDDIYLLQMKEGVMCLIVLEALNATYNLKDKYVLDIDPATKISHMCVKPMNFFTTEFIRHVFDVDEPDGLALFLSSRHFVYKSKLKDEKGQLSTLFSCPSNVISVQFEMEHYSSVLIFLDVGSFILLSARDESENMLVHTMHLNCEIDRIVMNGRSIFYSNPYNFWHATLSLLSSEWKIWHKNLKIKNLHDFALSKDLDIIYGFTLNNRLFNFKLDSIDLLVDVNEDMEFTPVGTLFSVKKTYEDLQKMAEENDQIARKINNEISLSATISLSRKWNFSMKHLLGIVHVYEDMRDLDLNSDSIELVTDLEQYYKKDVRVFLIKFSMTAQYNNVFKEKLRGGQQFRLCVELKSMSRNHIISLNLPENNHANIAIPVCRDLGIPMNIEIQVISLVPDAINKNVYTWCPFPCETIEIRAKNHLKLDTERNTLKRKITNFTYQKLDDRIVQISQHNTLFVHRIESTYPFKPLHDQAFYIKLPALYEKCAADFIKKFAEYANPNNSEIIVEKMNLNPNTELRFNVGDKKVNLSIVTDSNISKIKITGDDYKVNWDVYKYIFGVLVHFSDIDKNPTISHFDYMKVKKMKETLNKVLNSIISHPDINALMNMSEEFKRNTLGILSIK